MKNKQCRTHRYSQGGHVLQILEYLVILCFEKRRPKQKCCCLPEVKHFPPKVFGLATPLAGPPMTMMTKKKLMIVNMIQLSLLYFFCVTRLGTAKRCQFSVIF